MNRVETGFKYFKENLTRSTRAVIFFPKYHPRAFLFIAGLALGTLSEQQGINRDIKNTAESGAKAAYNVGANIAYGVRKSASDGLIWAGEGLNPDPAGRSRFEVTSRLKSQIPQ